MITQVITPTEKKISVDIPEEYLNHPIEIKISRIDEEITTDKKKKIENFGLMDKSDMVFLR